MINGTRHVTQSHREQNPIFRKTPQRQGNRQSQRKAWRVKSQTVTGWRERLQDSQSFFFFFFFSDTYCADVKDNISI